MITEDVSNEVTTSNDYYDNNQKIPTTTAKDRPDPPGFSVFDQDDLNKMTLEEQMQQFDEKCYNYFDNIDDDAKAIEIPPDMFDSDPTTETVTYISMMIKKPNLPVIDNTTTIEDEEEIPIPLGNFDIDDEFITSITTEEEESNPPIDNIRIVDATTIE